MLEAVFFPVFLLKFSLLSCSVLFWCRALLERHQLASVDWGNWSIIGLYMAFVLCMFVFYSLVTVVMKRTSATVFNLNILTADFYTLLASIIVFNYRVCCLFFIASLSIFFTKK